MRHARWIVIGLAIIFFAVCALLARRLRMEENITAMLPTMYCTPYCQMFELLMACSESVASTRPVVTSCPLRRLR